MNRFLWLALLLTAATVVSAQTNAPARDYGAGFGRLHQLGLPDVTGGVYGRLDITYSGNHYLWSSHYGDFSNLGMQGNAWKIRDLGGGTNRYIVWCVAVADVLDSKVHEKLLEQREDELAEESPARRRELAQLDVVTCAVGRWKEVDLKKDVARFLEKVEKSILFTHGDADATVAFLTAAQLYRSGITNEANRIAARLFAGRDDPLAMVREAMSRIAYAKHMQAYSAFKDSRDWAAWHRSLIELLGTTDRGWRLAPGVRKLAGLVKARADNTEPPAPQGEGLTDEDRNLARRLVLEPQAKGADVHTWLTCWILPGRQSVRPGQDSGTNDVIEAIWARGMKSVPLLIALLKEDALVQPDRCGTANAWWERVEDDGTPESLFNSLARPKTCREIAHIMLLPLLLLDGRQGEVGNMGPDDFTRECQAWYAEYKGKTEEELARIYFTKGNAAQQQQALVYLMQREDFGAKREGIERMFLDVVRESSGMSYTLQQYVRWRRGKASNFVEQVAVAMMGTNAPPKRMETAGRGQRSRQQAPTDEKTEFVKQLRELARDRSVKDMVAEYVSCTQAVAKAYQRLRDNLWQKDPGRSLAVILEAAGKTDDPEKRVALAEFVVPLRNVPPGGYNQFDPETMEPAGGSEPVKLNPTNHAALWGKLLKDKRGERRPVNVAAAWAIESLYRSEYEAQNDSERYYYQYGEYGPGDPDYGSGDPFGTVEGTQNPRAVVAFLGEQGVALLLERANARLAGKPVPRFPNTENVDEEQRAKLLRTVTSATNVAAELAKLSPDQQLALAEIGTTNRVLNAKLRPLADRIVEVKIEGDFKSAAGLEAKLKGRSFGRETVLDMLEVARKVAGDGVPFNLSLTRRQNVRGMEVCLSRPAGQARSREEPVANTVADTNRQEIVNVTGMAYAVYRSVSAWWPVRDPVAAPVSRVERRNPNPRSADEAGAVAKMAEEMDAEMLADGERQRKNMQDGFWNEVSLIVEKVGAYAPVGVSFAGAGKPVAVERVETSVPTVAERIE